MLFVFVKSLIFQIAICIIYGKDNNSFIQTIYIISFEYLTFILKKTNKNKNNIS